MRIIEQRKIQTIELSGKKINRFQLCAPSLLLLAPPT